MLVGTVRLGGGMEVCPMFQEVTEPGEGLSVTQPKSFLESMT